MSVSVLLLYCSIIQYLFSALCLSTAVRLSQILLVLYMFKNAGSYWPWVSLTLGGWGSWTLWVGIWQLTGLWMCPVPREGDVFGGWQTTLLLCCFTHCRISYRTSPVENRCRIWKHRRETSQHTVSLRTHSFLPELGQRRLKSSLVSRHRARPFISKRPFSGRRSEYSFWAQWSQWATSSLSHRDGFIPSKQMHIIQKHTVTGSICGLVLCCMSLMEWYLPGKQRRTEKRLTQLSR